MEGNERFIHIGLKWEVEKRSGAISIVWKKEIWTFFAAEHKFYFFREKRAQLTDANGMHERRK